MEWGIAGKPMPDLKFLTGPEYAAHHAKANEIMRSVVAGAEGNQQNEPPKDWGG